MATVPEARRPTVRFEGAIPILRVRDLQASVDYYTRALGFKKDWEEPGVMASVSRDRATLMLCEGHQGNPGTWVWVGVKDAAALFEEYEANGVAVGLPPTNYQWALEIHVQDPDGHILRFGSEPLEDRPVSEWVYWYQK
jgi:catechol 2,3-dioxygenase-like lactoylglutathione lyase family enzyme